MKKAVLFSAIGMLAAAGQAAFAQESARVISSTPVVQQVAVPRQVCGAQPMVQQSSGGGAVLGAIVGGLLGNTIGHGMGRAAATGVGIIAGAGVGDSVGRNSQPQYAQQCATQTTYENRTVAYSVVYEYNGQQHTVQMANDPGQSIRLQMTPVGAQAAAPSVSAAAAPLGAQPVVTAPPVAQIISSQPLMAEQVAVPSQMVYPATYGAYGYPVYAQPYYYSAAPAYYYPPVSLSFGLGYSRGWGGYGHRHWR